MIHKIYLSLMFVVLLSHDLLHAQTAGSISGYVFNVNDSTTIPGAQVFVKTAQKTYGTVTDLKGHFRLKPIEPGTYTVVITYSGLDTLKIKGTVVNTDLNTDLRNIYLFSKTLSTVEIIYHSGLIDEDGATIITINHDNLQLLPTKGDIKMVLTYSSSDYYVNERTKQVYFRGSRSGTSAFYIDGIRVEEMILPGMGVGSMQIYSGGVPAKYGDFTGGVIVVETKSYNDWIQEQEARKRYLKETEAPKIITVPKEKTKEEKSEKKDEKSSAKTR